jgi:hypothetical protein
VSTPDPGVTRLGLLFWVAYLAAEAWLFATIGLAWWLTVHGVCFALLALMLVCSSHDVEREYAERGRS